MVFSEQIDLSIYKAVKNLPKFRAVVLLSSPVGCWVMVETFFNFGADDSTQMMVITSYV